MRLCVPVPCFFKNIPFDEAILRIGELGFDAAETYDWSQLDDNKVCEAMKKSGVRLLSMCVSNFGLTDPENRKTWLAALRESCDKAKKLSVGMLITQVGNDTGKERAYQHESIVAGLREAKPILEEYGVTVMIEPLNTKIDHKGYYLWSAHEGFDIIRETGHGFAKVIYDTYHQQIMEGDIIRSVTGNLDVIAHLHAAGNPGRRDMTCGELDYKYVFSKIDEAGYKGACGLEYTPLGDPIESLITAKKLYGKENS